MADYTLKKIDNDFWHKVRIYCVTNNITIKDLIIKLLEKEIRKGEK